MTPSRLLVSSRWAPAPIAALTLVVRQEFLLRRHPLPTICVRSGARLELDGTRGRRPCGHPLHLSERERLVSRWTRKWLRVGLLPDTCLRRALATAQCFRHGHDVALQVGVADSLDSIQDLAHAWLVVDGHVTDPMAQHFLVLA